jgi:hypothetical protein
VPLLPPAPSAPAGPVAPTAAVSPLSATDQPKASPAAPSAGRSVACCVQRPPLHVHIRRAGAAPEVIIPRGSDHGGVTAQGDGNAEPVAGGAVGGEELRLLCPEAAVAREHRRRAGALLHESLLPHTTPTESICADHRPGRALSRRFAILGHFFTPYEIGRRRWKKKADYHRQAGVENAFFRY